MALELHIPSCIRSPPHATHPPPLEKPLRIQIQGPLESVIKLAPEVPWPIDNFSSEFPLPAGPKLAEAAFRALYGCETRYYVDRDLVVRDEYIGWVVTETGPISDLDFYGVTFDHLVPADDTDPDILQLNIVEMDNDRGAYAREVLTFAVDPSEYTGKKVLAVPRCCQKSKGTTDRVRINSSVIDRETGFPSRKGEATGPYKPRRPPSPYRLRSLKDLKP